MRKPLKELEYTFSSGVLSNSELVSVMVNFRLIIEEDNLQSNYPILNLYCNWTVHHKISRSNIAYRILEEITDSMIAHNNNPKESQWINDAIIEGMRLHKLQTEILDFSNSLGIDLKILSNRKFWTDFGNQLLSILIDRPLAFPDNLTHSRASSIYDSIVRKANESENLLNGVISISFFLLYNKVHWKIVTLDPKMANIDIVGQMVVITQDQVDSYNRNS